MNERTVIRASRPLSGGVMSPGRRTLREREDVDVEVKEKGPSLHVYTTRDSVVEENLSKGEDPVGLYDRSESKTLVPQEESGVTRCARGNELVNYGIPR